MGLDGALHRAFWSPGAAYNRVSYNRNSSWSGRHEWGCECAACSPTTPFGYYTVHGPVHGYQSQTTDIQCVHIV